MTFTECSSVSPLITASFWVLVVIAMYAIAKYNNFGFKDTALAAIGLRKFKRNAKIYILLVAAASSPVVILFAFCTT